MAQKIQQMKSSEYTKELLKKIENIEKGLSKALAAMNEFGETARDLLPQYMNLAERKLPNYRNSERRNYDFDPRTEMHITLSALEIMKGEIGNAKYKRARNHTFFVRQCLDVWIENSKYVGTQIELKKAWQGGDDNPSVSLFLTIRYLLTFIGVRLSDPHNWIVKALGEKV